MYEVQGTDGSSTGPFSADLLRERIAQGQIGPGTRVRRAGDAAWQSLSSLTEFVPDLAAVHPGTGSATGHGSPTAAGPAVPALPPPPPLPRPRGASAPPLPLPPRVRTSGMAVSSFVLACVTPCTVGISGLVGLLLGISALVSIRRSAGQLKGRGLALCGIVFSVLGLAFTLVGLGFLLPFIAQQHRMQAPAQSCPRNLQNVAMALRLYAEGHDGKYPAAANWCGDVTPFLQTPDLLRCPARPKLRSGYAYNRAIAGRTTSSVPPDTILLIESAHGWNGTAGPEDPTSSSPHGGSYSVAFADGSVREVDTTTLPSLRWEP